jgi:hypothetical protein
LKVDDKTVFVLVIPVFVRKVEETYEQAGQNTLNVTLRRVHATIIAVDKQ